jgi:uncharacterized phage protein (TIGR01671 family)
MREIKFRAWDSEQYEMSYSDPLDDLERAYSWFRELEDRDVKASGNIELMQYTGLKDKNGKEIYEGDIVKGGAETVVMEWKNEMWTEEGYITGFSELSEGANCYEIIGNLYENPELLKEKES